ncbi:hypothetical protein RCL_jg19537.t1 [Rhizophagus clarus]|nr:hypothetical protein RCL_jg19537.t1 [Rhizophagus clarus]
MFSTRDISFEISSNLAIQDCFNEVGNTNIYNSMGNDSEISNVSDVFDFNNNLNAIQTTDIILAFLQDLMENTLVENDIVDNGGDSDNDVVVSDDDGNNTGFI